MSWSFLFSSWTRSSFNPLLLLMAKAMMTPIMMRLESTVATIWLLLWSGPMKNMRNSVKMSANTLRPAGVPGDPSTYLCTMAATAGTMKSATPATMTSAFAVSLSALSKEPKASPQRPMSKPSPARNSPKPMMMRKGMPGQPRKGPQTLSKPYDMALFLGWNGRSFPAPAKRNARAPKMVPSTTVIHVRGPAMAPWEPVRGDSGAGAPRF
mmetsp:Transcript_91489/g.285173  ORF Transcript_91489/g.285173 Transcript_91489/m.285173 type:complete len:210 (-) Transcript_91489:13-642(-)